ncbi:MAG: hypothetical protein IKV39_03180 [Clostridia bacterium]|nr:hypothetical protein [Clostridia bacterium]
MTKFTRIMALCLALVMIFPLVGCMNDKDKAKGNIGSDEEVSLEDLDFDGEIFTIHTSINVAAHEGPFRSSNYLIQGEEEVTGDKASDSALQRNKKVEEDLNIRFSYIESDFEYTVVGQEVRSVVMAGAEGINLIINDNTCARLTAEGLFHDANYGKYFDFDQSYWYDGFMESSSLDANTRFLLAGDYFIDVIRQSHCLIMNKDYYTELGGDPEAIYDLVRKGDWTMDAMISMINGGEEEYNYLTGETGYSYNSTYIDTQGNHKRDTRDRYGIIMWQWWGPMIPFITSTDPGFIARDEDGYPVITVNNERTVQMAEKLTKLFHSESAAMAVHSSIEKTMNSFVEGNALFLTCMTLGYLESSVFANSEVNMAILPYPKLDDLQDGYVTTANGGEVGFIPATLSFNELDYVSAVVEYLNQMSAQTVIPKYYESTLKVRYARESANADMIQLIHDSAGNIFPYIWDLAKENNIFTMGVYLSVKDNSSQFASHYRSFESTAQNELADYIDMYDNVKSNIEAQYGQKDK